MEKGNKILPSGRFIGTVLAVLIAVALVLMASSAGKKQAEVVTTTPEARERNLITAVTTRDLDEDGLLDWEEDLWGTDPNNKDTDGDGTPDGVETQQQRNPLVAGPDDSLAQETPENSGTSSPIELDQTTTASYARTLFSRYITLKKSSGEIGQEEIDILLSSVPSTNTDNKSGSFSRDSLNIIADANNETLTKYNADLTQIFTSNNTGLESELIILGKYVESGDPSAPAQLDTLSRSYQKTALDLLGVNTPKDLATDHLTIINSLVVVSEQIESMLLFLDDPLVAVGALGTYNQATASFENALENIGLYLGSRGIILGS